MDNKLFFVPHTNWESKGSGTNLKTKEIPCLTGKGKPTAETAGAVGCWYMDTDSGTVYKCTAAADGVFTWIDLVNSDELRCIVAAYLQENPPEDGADGGHYTPIITQPTADTMKVEFLPSRAGMAAVEPVEIKLPVGSGNDSGQKVSLPVDANGDPMYGEAGQYAVSDGAGGIKWVSTAPDTGGDSGGGEDPGDGGIVDTTAKIAAYDKGYYWGSQIEAAAYTGACVTGIYPYTNDIDKMKAHSSYDAENDCMTGTTMFPGITYYIPNVKFIEAGNSVQSTRTKFAYARDGAFYGTGSVTPNAEKTTALGGKTNNDLYGNGVAFTLFAADVDDSYAYWAVTGSQIAPVGVRHGDIIFAGKNTPYYGMANIDGTLAGSGSAPETASIMSVDDDYAMDYGVSTLSLVTDDSASVAASTGLDVAYASAIEEAKNAWMVEANGNVDKIPLIIHTDQHGNFSKPLWDTIGKMVDWYEISKVVNLGDTVSAWSDADPAHPLTKCAYLEDYLDSTAAVPWSKRIEVFGNHDTWATIDGETRGLTPQNYLRKYFKNIYARGTDNYGNMVVYDDRYNVKYLIISGMAYDSAIGGYSHYIIPSASWDWIIAQLEMADGYDVVVMSHVALGSGGATIADPTGENNVTTCGNVDWVSRADFWAARKNKTGGSFTDQYGVSHAYDFSRCNSEILCGLHGHEHADGYYYVGNALLDAFFDAYYISPRAIHFVLIDRKNRWLNVWKVDDEPKVYNYQIPFEAPEGS